MSQKKTTGKITTPKEKSYQIDVLDIEGKIVEKMTLPAKIFGAQINEKLIAQAVRVYLANQRQGTQKTKSRGEIKASKAKIWRQKGTGRARHGARSAPIFVGGGVAHGPRPRDFSLKMPQKMRQAALFSALSAKFQEGEIMVIKGLEEIKPKVKEMVKVLTALDVGIGNKKKKAKFLIVLPHKLENLQRATRNISGASFFPASLLNTYLVLNQQRILFLKDSIPLLEKTFLDQEKPPSLQKVRRRKIENEVDSSAA